MVSKSDDADSRQGPGAPTAALPYPASRSARSGIPPSTTEHLPAFLRRLVSGATSSLRQRETSLALLRKRKGFLASVYRYKLTRRVLQIETDRMLHLGAANFLVILGQSLGLSLRCICVGCIYLHIFFDSFSFRRLERRCAAAACLLLAWKYVEDSEVTRCTRKLFDLARGIYRVSVHQKGKELREVRDLLIALERGDIRDGDGFKGVCRNVACAVQGGKENNLSQPAKSPCKSEQPRQSEPLPCPTSPSCSSSSLATSMSQKAAVAGLSSQELPKSSCPSQNSTIASQVLSDAWLADLASSSRWMHGDSAVGFRILCHKIRVYESGILRALRFNVGPLDLPFSALRLQLKAFLTRCSHAPSIHPTPPTTPTTTTATPVSSSSLSAHSIKQTSDGHLTDLCYHSSPSHKTPYHTPTSSSPSSSSSSSSTSRTGSSCCPTEESGRVQRRSRESSPSADAQQPGQGSERRSRPVAVGEGTKGVKKKTNTDTRKISEPTSSVKKENDHQGTNQKKRNSTSDCGTDSSGTAESPPSVRVTRSKSRGAMKGSSSSVGAVTTEVARSSDGSGGMTKKAVEDANEKKCREEVDTKEVKPGIGLEGKETKGLDHTVSSPSTPKTSGDTKVISKAEPPSVGSASSQGTEEIKKRGVTDSGGVQTDKEGEVEDFKSKAFCPVDFHPCCCESWPASGVAFAQLQDQLHSAALRELSLLFRTPFILERDTNAVVAACVIRAAIACGLPLAYSPPPPPPPAFSNTDRRDQGTHQPGDGTSTKTATPSPCGPSASGIRCINPEPVTEDLSKKSSARKDETHGRSFDAADEELRNPDKAIEMNERRVRSRVKTPTGEKGRERFLQALEAFDMHVERFLKGLKNPFWTRKTTVMRGGGSQDANTSKAARHEEDMDSDLTRGSQVFGVDPVEVQAALSELRLATIWMDDLLHTRGPLLLPSPVLTQPQTCRSVKRRDVFSSAHDDEKRRRVKFEMKITKTEEVGVAEELEEGAEERMVTSA